MFRIHYGSFVFGFRLVRQTSADNHAFVQLACLDGFMYVFVCGCFRVPNKFHIGNFFELCLQNAQICVRTLFFLVNFKGSIIFLAAFGGLQYSYEEAPILWFYFVHYIVLITKRYDTPIVWLDLCYQIFDILDFRDPVRRLRGSPFNI